MLRFLFGIVFICMSYDLYSQGIDISTLGNYVRLDSPQNSDKYSLSFSSDIDSSWNLWDTRSYHFGFDKNKTPMYTTVDGILSTPYMIQVRGNENEKNKKRWGFHVFEGYASDDMSRITMLVNKHVEEQRPVAELYYYGTEYNHSEQAYNWFRIGSDVRQHSFLFGRDKAIFYGSLKLTNALTIGNIGEEDLLEEQPSGDSERNYEEDAKYVNYRKLKEGGDGTLFYDKDRDIIVVKVSGVWMKHCVQELPEDVDYPNE